VVAETPVETVPLVQRLQVELPVKPEPFRLAGRRSGLVVIDEQNGFAAVGAGPLAPAAPNPQITRMIAETDRLARTFEARALPIAVFLDWHATDRPEPPYPPHCLAGTAEAELVPELAWLEASPATTILKADCINDFVGSIDPATGRNAIVEWVTERELDTLVVVGICTDICVAEFVATMLSARNHQLLGPLREVVVYEPGCATYDLPRTTAEALGLPATAAHPQAEAHHLGLWLMASRGAVLASEIG
jgi:nicotinamidase-related amidase